jgi:hypothetical protein
MKQVVGIEAFDGKEMEIFVWAIKQVQRWRLLFSETMVSSSSFMSNIRVSCRM